jgi:hypothetical protein
MDGTTLRRRTEPLSLDKSTGFMVKASTNPTDGRAFPNVIGDPISFTDFPLKFTWSPGVADARSIGISGLVVAQPKMKSIRMPMKIKEIFLINIKPSPFIIFLIPPFY